MQDYFSASKIPNCSLGGNGGVEDWKWKCFPPSVVYKLRCYIKMAVIHSCFIQLGEGWRLFLCHVKKKSLFWAITISISGFWKTDKSGMADGR